VRQAQEQRARSAANELTRQGTRVRFEQSIHVPQDEICFFVFGAPSEGKAALSARRAGLDPIRVVKAITITRGVEMKANQRRVSK
jgi:hypothetical protein